jgi:hypothetical protein
MVFRILVLLLSLCELAFANANYDDLCWTHEENPATLKPYSSQSEWESTVKNWNRQQHLQLNILSLLNALKVYKQDKAKSATFGNDKIAHCYIGCRISQKTSFKTARFVAWYKESIDLADCELGSHFEPADYEATVRGAHLGKNKSVSCEKECPALIEKL